MTLIQSVTVGDRVIDLHKFSGEVVDEKTWSSTQIAGGGGGYNAGSGQMNPASISSTTTTHDRLFIKDNQGQEMAAELANAGVAIRKGHRITVVWGIVHGNERGPFVAVYNHSTGDLTTIRPAIQALAVPPPPTLIMVAWAACVLGICVYGLGIIGLIALFITRRNLKRRLLNTLEAAVNTAMADIRGQKV